MTARTWESGSPHGWGRRVILNRLTGNRGRDADVGVLDELTYLLRSGSNRLGAIDFQDSLDTYTARNEPASLDDLHHAAQLAEAGEPLPVLSQVGRCSGEAGAALFQRIAFNIAFCNTHDHLRNHAAFWDGQHLDLTPAYDLSPMDRSGETATQAIAYGRDGKRDSNFGALFQVCHEYGLAVPVARQIIDNIIDTIHDGWVDAADAARLSTVDRDFLWGRPFLNPGSLYGYIN